MIHWGYGKQQRPTAARGAELQEHSLDLDRAEGKERAGAAVAWPENTSHVSALVTLSVPQDQLFLRKDQEIPQDREHLPVHGV